MSSSSACGDLPTSYKCILLYSLMKNASISSPVDDHADSSTQAEHLLNRNGKMRLENYLHYTGSPTMIPTVLAGHCKIGLLLKMMTLLSKMKLKWCFKFCSV